MKNRFALKELATKDLHKLWSDVDVPIERDSSDKVVEQLFQGLEVNEELIAEATRSRQSAAIIRNVSRLAKLDAWVLIRHHCAIIPHLQLAGTLAALEKCTI